MTIHGLAAAQEARPLAENPQAEARLKALAVELRCLVCQNQTLADSNAPLAEDLRREVLLESGKLPLGLSISLWELEGQLQEEGLTLASLTIQSRDGKTLTLNVLGKLSGSGTSTTSSPD